jgi:hypothetical protein
MSPGDKTALDNLVEIEDEGGSIGTGFRKINFIGAGVTAVAAGDTADVTIPGGGGGGNGGALQFGADRLGNTTTTRYLFSGYADALAHTIPPSLEAPRAGTIRNLYVRHNVTAGNGNAIVYTVRVNGVATAITASLASTGTSASDTTNAVVVAAGDRIDIEVTKAAGIAGSPSEVIAMLEYA